MKCTALRLWLQEQRSTLLLTTVILTLGLGLVFTRPSRPALADNDASSVQPLTPMTTLTATSPPTQTATPTSTLTPSSTPTTTPSLTPTWTPIPATTDTPTPTATPRPAYLVWSPQGNGGYLREEPNGRILLLLENGTYLETLGDTQQAAGLAWWHVLAYFPGPYQSSQTAGWMAARLLYPLPTTPLVQVISEAGAYLRAAPQGRILTWVGLNSPLMVLDRSQPDWWQVQTLDGQSGWLATALLQSFQVTP